MKKILILLSLGIIIVFAKPQVSVTILPQSYFVQKIAGDTLKINVMIPPNADPHVYEPKPRQMLDLEKSDIYFALGTGMEGSWLDKFHKTYPKMKISRTYKGIKKIMLDENSTCNHDHGGHEGHHHHGAMQDPHIWLDPILVKTMAKNIANDLIKYYPQNKDLYLSNLKKFEKECDMLDVYIKDSLKSVKNRNFIVYHPSWGYYATRYNLNQISIEIEGKEPKIADLANLIKKAKEENIKVIFVQPQFSKKSAKEIAKATNSQVVEIDQLAFEWENELRKTTDIFANYLK